MESISVLKTPLTLCKHFAGNGSSVESLQAAMPAYFIVEQIAVKDIKSLSDLLIDLEKDPHRAIIRGIPADDVHTEKLIRRKLRRSNTAEPNEAPFLDHAASWIMIDVDKLLLPEGLNLLQVPLCAIEFAVQQLPPEFHETSYHWQLSASAGLKESNTLSAHLYFWLDRPIPNESLRAWARSLGNKRLVDPAVFNAVQLHYTAAPLFSDSNADLFSNNRSGFVAGTSNTVSLKLPSPEEVAKRNSDSTSSMVLDENRIRGFSNILATLGDHEGGNGFYEPLLRATASYVSKVGRDTAETSIDSLIENLQSAIDNADQSNHSYAEIERYRSEEFLNRLIEGALDKFGDTPELPPYFDIDELNLHQGEEALDRAITSFAQGVRDYNEDPANILLMDAPRLAIKATAGLGKTSAIISKLISESALKTGDIHYFVPNHRLSKELVHDLETELNFPLPESVVEALGEDSGVADYMRVRLISGRGQLDSTGRTMCWKNEIASKVAASGQAVSSALCKNGNQQCDYYEQCGYQDQFEESGIEIPKDDPLTEIFWEV